jgi:hypothetical protein
MMHEWVRHNAIRRLPHAQLCALQIETLFPRPTAYLIDFNKVDDRTPKWQIQPDFAYQ